jgi:hypothetical protein
MQHSSEDFICPVCKQIDRVEKVSVVHAAGTSTGAYSGGTVGIGVAGGTIGLGGAHTNLTGMSQTNLSQRLAPPAPPPPPEGAGCFVGGLLFLLLIAGMVGLETALTTEISNTRLIAAAVVVACAAGFAGIITITSRSARVKKAKHAEQVARWQQAIMNWERLYYCGRNDIVFIPGMAESCVPAYELYKLL